MLPRGPAYFMESDAFKRTHLKIEGRNNLHLVEAKTKVGKSAENLAKTAGTKLGDTITKVGGNLLGRLFNTQGYRDTQFQNKLAQQKKERELAADDKLTLKALKKKHKDELVKAKEAHKDDRWFKPLRSKLDSTAKSSKFSNLQVPSGFEKVKQLKQIFGKPKIKVEPSSNFLYSKIRPEQLKKPPVTQINTATPKQQDYNDSPTEAPVRSKINSVTPRSSEETQTMENPVRSSFNNLDLNKVKKTSKGMRLNKPNLIGQSGDDKQTGAQLRSKWLQSHGGVVGRGDDPLVKTFGGIVRGAGMAQIDKPTIVPAAVSKPQATPGTLIPRVPNNTVINPSISSKTMSSISKLKQQRMSSKNNPPVVNSTPPTTVTQSGTNINTPVATPVLKTPQPNIPDTTTTPRTALADPTLNPTTPIKANITQPPADVVKKRGRPKKLAVAAPKVEPKGATPVLQSDKPSELHAELQDFLKKAAPSGDSW